MSNQENFDTEALKEAIGRRVMEALERNGLLKLLKEETTLQFDHIQKKFTSIVENLNTTLDFLEDGEEMFAVDRLREAEEYSLDLSAWSVYLSIFFGSLHEQVKGKAFTTGNDSRISLKPEIEEIDE